MENAATSFVGGVLIGLGASLLLVANGRIAGVSGMVAGLLPPERGDWAFRAWFIGGLCCTGAVAAALAPEVFGGPVRSLAWLAAGGLLVGIGTRIGGGCTSGHGVCGVSRFAPRSILATLTFVAMGMATVALLRWAGVAS